MDIREIFGSDDFTFVTSEYEDSKQFNPIPPGSYIFRIESADGKQTKNGNGCYVEVVLVVVEGNYIGRKVWDRINLVNKSTVAESIARGQFKALCEGVGIQELKSLLELNDKFIKVRIAIDKSGNNCVKSYSSAIASHDSNVKTNAGSPLPHPPPPVSHQSQSKRPWEK